MYLYSPLCCCSVTKSRLTLLRPHGLQPARLPCPWDFPGKNITVGCHFPSLQHWQADSLPLNHQGSPYSLLVPHKNWSRYHPDFSNMGSCNLLKSTQLKNDRAGTQIQNLRSPSCAKTAWRNRRLMHKAVRIQKILALSFISPTHCTHTYTVPIRSQIQYFFPIYLLYSQVFFIYKNPRPIFGLYKKEAEW